MISPVGAIVPAGCDGVLEIDEIAITTLPLKFVNVLVVWVKLPGCETVVLIAGRARQRPGAALR